MNMLADIARTGARRPAASAQALLTLSPTEERYVMAERLTRFAYTIPRLYRIEGQVDAARLAAAVQALVERHAALRTGFVVGGDNRARKYIDAEAAQGLEILDMPGAGLDEVNERLRPLLMAKPDFTPASLASYHLVLVAPDLAYFSFSNHHAISDGQSARIALDEIFALYRGETLPPPGPPPHELYPDDWAETPAYRDQLAYWTGTLEAAPAQAELPADIVRAEGPEVAALTRTLSPAAAAALTGMAGALGVTEFTVAYAVLIVLLGRLTGEDDVLTAFQSNGRRGLPAEAARSVGGFSNALILRAPMSPAQSFAGFARDVGARLRAAADHELPPYHHVIATSGVHPKFGFNWFPAPPLFEVPGLAIADASHELRESDYQLNFRMLRAGPERRLVVYYAARELSQGRIEAMFGQYEALAAAFAADPDRALSDVRIAGPVPVPGGEVAAPISAAPVAPITAGFLAQAAARPDHPAIEAAGVQLSYGALAARAGGIAALIDEGGVPPGATVAIVAARGAALVAGMLGVSLGGRPFMVLDSAYPDTRLAQMIELARPTVLLAGEEGLHGRAEALARAVGLPLIVAAPELAAAPRPVAAPADATAYYLFTSGTTGTPKGLAIGHRPLAHFTRWQAERFGIGPGDRVTMLSGLGHDPLLRDVFTTLSAGATLLIPTQDDLLQPCQLGRWMVANAPTRCHLTPAIGELMLAATPAGAIASVRSFFWGGDLLRPALVARVRQAAPRAAHVNFYGATETPQAAAHHPVDLDDPRTAELRTIPVGRATPGFQAEVVDGEGRPCAAWEPGNIAIRSPLLALGHVEAGAVRPFATPGVHDSGDRGFHRDDGAIQLIGRADDQVKIRGHRVEPADIAAALERHPAVSRAAVLAIDDGARRQLVAFTVDDVPPDERIATLAAHAARQLPAHMVPEAFVAVEALPLLPSGKIDRAALTEAHQAAVRARAPAASRFAATADELQLIEAWQRVLGKDGITPDDSLVSLGGDSLSFVNLYLATEEALGAVPDGWQVMSVRDLARTATKADRWWRPVDTSMLTRAIAIFLVVAAHLQLIPYLAGATTALFLVTGYLFGGLQLPTAFRLKSERPLVRMMANLIIPVMLFSIGLYLAKLWAGQSPHHSILTLTGNFFDYRLPGYEGRAFYLWYIHCAVQILLIVFMSFVLALRFAPDTTPWRFAMTLFLIGLVTRFVPPALMVEDFFTQGTPILSMWSYLPTTHLPTVMLGVLVALADTPARRRLLTPLVLAYGSAQLAFFPGWGGAYVILFGLMLLYVRRVPLPRSLSAVVLPLSGASLYIYLTHFQVQGLLARLGLGDWPLLHVLAALLVGIGLWKLYSRLAAAVTQRISTYIGPEEAAA